MPYERNADLPAAVRRVLPEEAQTIFRRILNNALEQYEGDEARAFATAWAGLRRAGWQRGQDGKWHKVEKRAAEPSPRREWRVPVNIAKMDDDQQLVFGWLSVSQDEQGRLVVDHQGDIIEPDELERMAYDFVLEARRAGEMHKRWEGVGRLVESMVFTRDKQEALGIPPGILPVGWWVGFKIDDPDVWAKVKSGEYRAFSIGGTGIREEVTDDADAAQAGEGPGGLAG